jgi:uncharacterized protein YjbJ (UPF0337 family)
MSASDKAENKADKLVGKAKEKIGRAIGDRSMENEGRADRLKATMKDRAEKVEDAFRR